MKKVRGSKLGLFVACVLCVCSSHAHLSKRSDDPSPLEAVVQKLTAEVSSLQAGHTALKDGQTALKTELQILKDRDGQTVAFSAYIAEANVPETAGGVIRFSRTITNTGGAYNTNTGAFTAPYDGVYFFIVSVDISPDYEGLGIYKSNHALTTGNNDGRDAHHTVATCTVTLTSGDTVTVRHVGEVKGFVDGGQEAVFVGFKIR